MTDNLSILEDYLENYGSQTTDLPCWCGDGNTSVARYGADLHCFKCNKHIFNADCESVTSSSSLKKNNNSTKKKDIPAMSEPIPSLDPEHLHVYQKAVFDSWDDRNLSKEASEKYGIKSILGQHGELLARIYPMHDPQTGEVKAFQIRNMPKQFTTYGKGISQCGLVGQQAFPPGSGKFLTITEGAEDAVAVYQMMGCKYPVVSLKNGAGSAEKDIRNSLDYIKSFDKVILCFDNDTPGKEAADKVARILRKRCKIMHMDYKDACEYLIDGKQKEFIDRWWKAQDFKPEGVLTGLAMVDEILRKDVYETVDYPWKGLNDLTYGLRTGEMITLTAGTGIGKTKVMSELIYYLFKNTKHNIGVMYMEQSPRKTGLALTGLHLNRPIHLPVFDNMVSESDKKQAATELFGEGRIQVFNHFGSYGIEDVIEKMDDFVADGCKYLFLDHISILVSGGGYEGDERRALDEIATKLRQFVEERGVSLICAVHLKRPGGEKGFEDGLQVTLNCIRGSGAIAQLSDLVLGLERNGQAEEEYERNLTHIRVLKNRFSGDTGSACYLHYDKLTGRLHEVNKPVEEPNQQSANAP